MFPNADTLFGLNTLEEIRRNREKPAEIALAPVLRLIGSHHLPGRDQHAWSHPLGAMTS